MCFHFVASSELLFDISSMGLTMVVPWSLPEELQDDVSELKATMEKIFKDKVGEGSFIDISVQRPHMQLSS